MPEGAAYKIMLVDDEEEVREAIAGKVDWASLGFQVVATAANGEEALEFADAHEVDVLLTDIKMPFMDGLTLGRHMKERHPGVRIIILTGFDQFEYAKQAISINTVEYILKPVNEKELRGILTQVKENLDADLLNKRNVEILCECYNKFLPILRERFLYELLCGQFVKSDISSQIGQFSLPFVYGRQKNVLVLETDVKTSKNIIASELVPVFVKRIADTHCEGRCVVESFINGKAVIVVTEWETKSPIGGIIRLANEICEECYRVSAIKVTAGIGRCYSSLTKLCLSYDEALSALEYKAVASGNVIYICDMEAAELEDTTANGPSPRRFASVVKFGSPGDIALMIDGMTAAAEENAENRLKYQLSVINILGSVIYAAERLTISETELFATEDFFRFLSCDISAFKQWLLDLCLRMNALASARRISTEEKLIEGAKAYIAENYSNPKLTVDVMCEHLHISQSYFSALFKKITGQTYVNYLTEFRLQKALELLAGSDAKTYCIAGAVGYEEPNYFSYVFRKRFGITPSAYRRNLQKGTDLDL